MNRVGLLFDGAEDAVSAADPFFAGEDFGAGFDEAGEQLKYGGGVPGVAFAVGVAAQVQFFGDFGETEILDDEFEGEHEDFVLAGFALEVDVVIGYF